MTWSGPLDNRRARLVHDALVRRIGLTGESVFFDGIGRSVVPLPPEEPGRSEVQLLSATVVNGDRRLTPPSLIRSVSMNHLVAAGALLTAIGEDALGLADESAVDTWLGLMYRNVFGVEGGNKAFVEASAIRGLQGAEAMIGGFRKLRAPADGDIEAVRYCALMNAIAESFVRDVDGIAFPVTMADVLSELPGEALIETGGMVHAVGMAGARGGSVLDWKRMMSRDSEPGNLLRVH